MSNFIDVCKCTRDGETLGSAGKVAKFTVVVRSPMKNKDTGEYDSIFLEVLCFNKNIDKALQVKKGDFVGVVGSLSMNKYTNKDGVEKVTPQIVADEVKPLAFSAKSSDANGSQVARPKEESAFVPPMEDTSCNLPFDL